MGFVNPFRGVLGYVSWMAAAIRVEQEGPWDHVHVASLVFVANREQGEYHTFRCLQHTFCGSLPQVLAFAFKSLLV